MKRLLLAGLLALPFAPSRARADQTDAYGSLIGMAGSASTDKGPDAGEIPADGPSAAKRRAGAPVSGDEPPAESGSARADAPAKKGSASVAPAAFASGSEAAKDDGEVPVAVPAAVAPRVWTRLFSSLIRPSAPAVSFDIAVSTAPRRVRPEPARAATSASAAGAARGLRELVAAATAP